ncbi:hypothetical protein HK104_009105 [Borealophlyctis nickersoniae]|nr:hypothetical protein HK104_009105 [Borealophlyctis nickersoniae]
MLRSESPSTPSLQTAEKPTKASKARRKAARAAAAADPSSAVQSPPAPLQPSDSAVSLESASAEANGGVAVNKNPYIEAINKRLRTLKKKLTKVEKYEAMDKKDLNADQIQAVQKKPEVASAVKEFEEIIKQLETVGAEEAKAALDKEKVAQQQEQLKIAEAVKEAQNASQESTMRLLQLLFVLNVSLPNLATSSLPITEEQYNALAYFRLLTTGYGMEAPENAAAFLESAQTYIQKYSEQSAEQFAGSVTYAELNELVEKILSPPAPPKFGIDAESGESPALPEAEYEAGPASENEVEGGEVRAEAPPSAPGIISFFNPSEVLGIEETVTEEIVTTSAVLDDHTVVETVTDTITITTTTELEVPLPEEVGASSSEAASSPAPQAESVSPDAQTSQDGQGQPRGHRGRGRGRGGFRGRGRGGYRDQNGNAPMNQRGGGRGGRPHHGPRGNGQQGGQGPKVQEPRGAQK